MAADLTRKRRSRTAYRKHCKRIEGELSGIFYNFDPEDNSLITKLTALKTNYQAQLEKVRVLDEEISDLVDPDDIEEELSNSLIERDKSYEMLAEIDTHFSKLSIIPTPWFNSKFYVLWCELSCQSLN